MRSIRNAQVVGVLAAGGMKMGRGPVDGTGGGSCRILADKRALIRGQVCAVKRMSGNRFVPVVGSAFGGAVVLVVLPETSVQLAFTGTANGGVFTIEAEVLCNIVLVHIEIGDDDGFAEDRQQQGQQYTPGRQAFDGREQDGRIFNHPS